MHGALPLSPRPHRQECRERCLGENGAGAPRVRGSRRSGKKPKRRGGSTSFADRSSSTSETCRGCRTDHQAARQHAVTTANTMRNVGLLRTWQPRSKSLTRRSRYSIAGVMTLATNTGSVALGMMTEARPFPTSSRRTSACESWTREVRYAHESFWSVFLD